MSIFLASLSIACFAFVYRSDGLYHGLWYARNNYKENKNLEKYGDNIHEVGDPTALALAAGIYLQNLAWLWTEGISGCLAAIFFTGAVFSLGGYFRQIWINRGSGLPDINPNEDPYWYPAFLPIKLPKLWYGKRRWLKLVIAMLSLIFGILIIRIW